MDFKTIDRKYRPVPFWSWNEKLEVNETTRQIRLMDAAGLGGFFMHARGGLQTEYMGEEWFENVAASIDEAEKTGMHAWAYDENGWPSGFGDGRVNGLGLDYQQKYLRVCRKTDKQITENIIYEDGDIVFYYDVNPFYVDTLDPKVTEKFIELIYEPYYEKFKNRFDGFFTDEPQISRNGIPWSFILPDEFEKEYGYSVLPHLIELFYEKGDYVNTRMRFWRLVTMMFSDNFMKRIYDWCTSHGLMLTGHVVLEESLEAQLTTNGACMPHYEYFHIPGMDWLGRPILRCLTAHQVASTAAQTGKKQVLSECFACCGHNVSFEELSRNYEWMMVRGINLLCQHLEGYTLRGLRKRDYPPALNYQQPWWDDYKQWNEHVSRIGMLLSKGRITTDTLVMHNETSGWICYNTRDYAGLHKYNGYLLDVIDKLEAKHINFHLGDEILMERHGRVEGDTLVIGEMRYKKVVIPRHIKFFDNTEKLLAQFKANGGLILAPEELAANPITDNAKITYEKREFDGFTMHYFVNSTSSAQNAKINCTGRILDTVTGDLLPFTGSHTFAPMSSLVVIDDGTPLARAEAEADIPELDLTGDWEIIKKTYNSLTLDKCTYYFDGELQETDGYVLNVAQRANALERPVDLTATFKAYADYVPEKMMLACETPEVFEITVNGKPVDKKDKGYFRDHSFRLLDISGLLHEGENEITLKTRFVQSEKVYENIKKSAHFESEKNKLTYDMEFESVYLVGDFGVRMDGTFERIPNDAYFFDGKFALTKPENALQFHRIDLQGYPFFSGEITLRKHFAKGSGKLKFNKRGINAIRVSVNGKYVRTLIKTPYELDISQCLTEDDNTVELTAVNNLRNLLGPHHHVAGELLGLGPEAFYAEPCLWNGRRGGSYTEKYCFVETSLI